NEVGRCSGAEQFPVGLALDHCGLCVADRRTRKRWLVRAQFEQDAAKRPDVRALVYRLAPRLLGTHVTHRPQDYPELRRISRTGCRWHQRRAWRRAGHLCQAEIENLDRSVESDLDVARFEVPVDDPALVRRLQAFGQLPRDSDDFVERQWTGSESLGQSRTLDEFEHERGDARALLQAVDCSDVRMIQRGKRTSLLLEAGETIRILRAGVGPYFDRDGPLEFRAAGAIDLAHPARAEKRLDPKRTQLAARRQTFYGAWGCDHGRLAKRSGVVVCPE